MSVEDLVRDEIREELLAELIADILPIIAPDEVTASQLAARANVDPTNAKELLDAKVRAGTMTSRLVRAGGRRTTAYRKVIHLSQ